MPRRDFARLRAVSRAHESALIGSSHDFQETPNATALTAKFALSQRLKADIAKEAVIPRGRRTS